MTERKEPFTTRISPELRRRVEEAAARHPYPPSMTAMIERGLELAIRELNSLNPPEGA